MLDMLNKDVMKKIVILAGVAHLVLGEDKLEPEMIQLAVKDLMEKHPIIPY